MAQRVEHMPLDARRNPHYKWEEWLDGSVWLLEPGVDFEVSPGVFRGCAYAAAARMGLRAAVAIRPDGVYVHASPRGDK